MSKTPEDLRRKAAVHRERGNLHMAEVYEGEARTAELLIKLRAQTEEIVIVVRRQRYRVSLHHNDADRWSANAHASGSIMPDAYVDGYTNREECLTALKDALRRQA